VQRELVEGIDAPDRLLRIEAIGLGAQRTRRQRGDLEKVPGLLTVSERPCPRRRR
jgi:hypothetical protein